MTHDGDEPMGPPEGPQLPSNEKHPFSVSSLLASLRHLCETDSKAVRAHVHIYPSSIYTDNGGGSSTSSASVRRDRRITSWKMTEHMYRDANNRFPTLARGLFTEELGEEDALPKGLDATEGRVQERIVARGYDKFFNIGETEWTSWDAMRNHTEPPYYLTLKSNGCLIMISALTPEHLMVASKHSLGTTTEDDSAPGMDDLSRGVSNLQMESEESEGAKMVPGAAVTEHAGLKRMDLRETEYAKAKGKGKWKEKLNGSPTGDPTVHEAADGAVEQQGDDIANDTEGHQGKKGKTNKNESKRAKQIEELHKQLGDQNLPHNKREHVKQRLEKIRRAQEEEVRRAAAEEEKQKREAESLQSKENGEDALKDMESRAHAEVGREWVKRTLRVKGKTEAQLARRLWEGNMTAVAELCDDSFEEHVIATPAYWTGLHLHGLNHNTPHFSTAGPDEVASLAAEFGFIPTKSVKVDTLDDVKSFTEEVAKTGAWEGDQIEGFVVRSTVRASAEPGKPPYRPGAPFFFKVKFEEPYLLYRQWREVTRDMLPLLSDPDDEKTWKKVRKKMKRPEVGVYVEWAWGRMQDEPALFEGYNKGVVRVRERFLAWVEGDGRKVWAAAKAGTWKMGRTAAGDDRDREGLPKKWMLVPIAIPGCGKTLIGLALTKLFGFAHTQSDDVTTKKTAAGFLRNIGSLLHENDVVYADRNNHIDKHYEELDELARKMAKDEPAKGKAKQLAPNNVRMVGIVWQVDALPYQRVLRVCSDRIAARGDNHQTLRVDPEAEAEHEAVVGKFLRDFTQPDPELFDHIVEVGVEDAPIEALRKVVDGLVGPLWLKRPSDAELEEALAAAGRYRVTIQQPPMAKVGQAVRYYGLAPEIDLAEVVGPLVASAKEVFDAIKAAGRISARPHVTLCHEKNVEAEAAAAGRQDVGAKDRLKADGTRAEDVPKAGEVLELNEADETDRDAQAKDAEFGSQARLWAECKAVAAASPAVLYEFDLTHLVWDERAMALILDKLRPSGNGPPLHLPQDVEAGLHITLGTRREDISAYEANALTRVAREKIRHGKEAGEAKEVVGGGGPMKWMRIGPVKGEGRVRGMS